MLRPLVLTLLTFLVGPLVAAPTHTVVAEFEKGGQTPMSRLLYVASAGKFYGTTSTGGAYGKGTIFTVTAAGVRETLVSFSGVDGPAKGEAPDAGLVRGNDGNLYGVTAAGGANDCGTIYRLSTGGNLTTLVEFTGSTGSAKGAIPNELVLAADGDFYGTTQAGGANDQGTVYRLNLPFLIFPASINTLVEFTGTTTAPRGSMPMGALIANGNLLYGVTTFGGAADAGTVFRVTTSGGTFTTMAEFTGTSGTKRGAYPSAGLLLQSDGKLYGTTEYGGADDAGTVFSVGTGTGFPFTTLFQFDDTNGAYPGASLVLGSGQTLYGTTTAGGAHGYGTIFRIETATPFTHTVLASFSGEFGSLPGDFPAAALAAGALGEWYGTTSAGGAGNYGTIFRMNAAGQVSSLVSFSGPEGSQPAGAPIPDGSGGFLIPLAEGGLLGEGTIVRTTATAEAHFGEPGGSRPSGSMVKVGSQYYGVTRSGGANNRGTFYTYIPGTGITTLANFSIATGSAPEGPPTLGPDGFLYCVAREGGQFNKGSILRFSLNGNFAVLASFSGTSGAVRGALPRGQLLLGSDNHLYGVTEFGGTVNRGTVFRIPPEGGFETMHEFGASGPSHPRAGLISFEDGNFYGTTALGGTANLGTVFKITPAGTVTTLAEFNGTNGANPEGRLLAAIDGTLYGTTVNGGNSDSGTVFRVKPDSPLQSLIHFTGVTGNTPGEAPIGGLIKGPDGMFYGATVHGGSLGGGTIFRISAFGPHVVTDPPKFQLALSTLRGRVQAGGQVTVLQFQYGTNPNLLLPLLGLPTSSVDEEGITSFALALPELLPGQSLYYRAVASGLLGETVMGEIYGFTSPTPLLGWKLDLIGSSAAGDLDDPDGDLIANLLEYALVTNPLLPNPGPPAPSRQGAPGGERLSITLTRDPARNDVTISVLASPTLAGPWTTIAQSVNGAPFTGSATISETNAENSLKTVQIRDVVPIKNSQTRFLRVSASN